MRKNSLKQFILISILITIVFSTIFITVNIIQNKKYSKILNNTLGNMVNKLVKEYPNITEEEIIELLSTKEKNEDIMIKYGYDEQIAYIEEIKDDLKKNTINNLIIFIIFNLVFFGIYIICIYRQEKKIRSINEYLKQINNKNYILKIEENQEGELSKLSNELYKTTVLLKEIAENNQKEKEQLSNSLADISHQIKTPLTSIRIMLDNILANPDMEKTVRKEFLEDINKQIEWIISLTISLLKLAKFDAGVIKMNNQELNVNELINNIIANLSILIETKNIKIEKDIPETATFIGDYKWQQEAITNIIKNAIEHSKKDGTIYIKVEKNSVFLKIEIKDEGEGIEKEDLKHIFERFYKAKNTAENNMGIGLALAKTIIEKNNGYISVSSEKEKGTTFEIKFIK